MTQSVADLQTEKRYVLYLTPAEADVWTNVQVLAQEHGGDLLVDIPVDSKELVRLWRAERLDCTVAEYFRAVMKLTRSDILEEKELVAKGTRRRYAFRLHPEVFLAVEIARRRDSWDDEDTVGRVHCVRNRFIGAGTAPPSREGIMAAADEICRETMDPNDEHYQLRLIWFANEYLLGHWSDGALATSGIFYPVAEGADLFLVAFPGYEPFRSYDFERRPTLGPKLLIFPAERADGGFSSSHLLPPVKDNPECSDYLDLLPYGADGELELDWMEPESLVRLTDGELELHQQLCHELQAQAKVWSQALEEVVERRQREEKERVRRERELSEHLQELNVAIAAVQEAKMRQRTIEARLKEVDGLPKRRQSRPFVMCGDCHACPAIPGEQKCSGCIGR